jgi:hypothetical protein
VRIGRYSISRIGRYSISRIGRYSISRIERYSDGIDECIVSSDGGGIEEGKEDSWG